MIRVYLKDGSTVAFPTANHAEVNSAGTLREVWEMLCGDLKQVVAAFPCEEVAAISEEPEPQEPPTAA
jgi:hypothetical protein